MARIGAVPTTGMTAICLGAALFAAGIARATELKFLCAAGLRSPMSELIPAFENSSGHKVTVVYETIGALMARIEKGEVADVTIVSQPQIESLIKKGIIDRASTVSVAKFSVGMAVRKRAPKPDISTVEGFERSLMAAKSIGYNDPATGSPAGIHIAKIIERLGLAADLRTKIKLNSGSQPTFEALANGDIEIGFAIVSQILEDPRVDLVAPLPAEIQDITVLTAGLIGTTKESEAGKALITFASSPAATAVYKARGLGLD